MFGSSTFQETSNISCHQTINPNFTFHDPLINMNQDHGHYNKYQDFDHTSFLDLLVDGDQEYSNSNNSYNASFYSQNTPFMQQEISTSTYSGNSSSTSSFDATPTNIHMNENSSMGMEKEKKAGKYAIAFRTKTELEILDDGYKWRKYGKKKVKSNTYLRNYYKCSSGDCKVKKKVERDGTDSRYLITTYEGQHNHERPFVIYCHEMPTASLSNEWSLQATSS
ncbi:probable WRKY transcription factor 50 [Lycium barbarum]|uniref:probable WRKY transcription factor 50 n=1 Tax=Lycium barbarum TaxID=112863 RepID=UPI00293EDA84|nr:probable WRKY transcription factor 50 [Lycium barbarum]